MRIAIVGTGSVAQGCYLPFLHKQPDVQLFYFSRTRARAEACAQQFGGEVCDSLAGLVEHDPAVVFVLTNETTRAEVLRELVPLRPARLFLEKPLVAQQGQDNVTEADFATARELMQQLHAGACQTAMIFNYRFFDQVQAARKIAAERGFGAPVNATALVNYACWSHCIDLLHNFFGPVETVLAQEGSVRHRHGDSEAPDRTAALRFANGASGTLLGSWALSFEFPLFELVLNFQGGRFHLRCLDGDLEILDYETHRHETWAVTRNTSRWDQYRASFGKSIGAYLESLRQGGPPPVPGVAGLEELRFEAALGRAAREGRPVPVRQEFPLPTDAQGQESHAHPQA
ncbi:MAG: Gfo/Idh/MocA family oxidoreductase [Candidatus Latescibacterota bacterium]